ncbi:hypothetical protein L6R52_41910, partial [Myxococcota bacterium]|nr:hypothetical protein [Myxococcota bacterium]
AAAPDAEPVDAGVPECPALAADVTPEAAYHAIVACVARDDVAAPEKAAAIEAFVDAVDARGGFPIRVAEGYAVVYVRTERWDARDDGAPGEAFDDELRQLPIRVVGDFNAWDPATGVELTHAGAELFHGVMPVPTSTAARAGYKLVSKRTSGLDVFFSDPLSRRFDFDTNGRMSLVHAAAGRPHLEWLREVRAPRLGDVRPIYVWLPPGYPSAAPYPVLYMHDGNNLFHRYQWRSAQVSWVVGPVIEDELRNGRIRAPIVVGIPNDSDRFDEYTHVQDDYGRGLTGGRADDYAELVVDVVKPLVDARYEVSLLPEDTGVLGSSLGGLVSYHLGLGHPEVFGLVAGMSSTFGWGRFGALNETMIERYTATPELSARGQRFYLDSGGGPPEAGACPGGVGPQPGEDNYCETFVMRDVLVGLGRDVFPVDADAAHLEPRDATIYHYAQLGAPHHESSWHQRFFRVLRFFFPSP